MESITLTRLVVVLFLAAVLMALSACGGSSSDISPSGGGAQSLTAGNWLLVATSANIATSGSGATRIYTFLRGPLRQSGNTVSATMGVASQTLRCYQDASPNVLSGSIDGSDVTLTSSSVGGSVLTITAPINSTTNFNGTYSSTQGAYCINADSGTVYGVFVPSITGNWGGTLSSSKYGSVAVSGSIQQGAATSGGIFLLSGTVTFQNYPCFTSGVIDSTSSYIQGETVLIVANASDGTTVRFSSPYLSNPTTATEIDYSGYTVQGGTCGFDFVYAPKSTLTKS